MSAEELERAAKHRAAASQWCRSQAGASRGERQSREGWVRRKGAMRIGGDGVSISRKSIVRARGVCGMVCVVEAVEACGQKGRGAETRRKRS